ncbi:alpha/beta hydrolase [Paenibacillus sp. S150]|uniref:alpha/beta hydrolase n=1 Tax=Paenibacillus sp. S150 TaxID=2749826 RepID=UPI001C57C998|nr:alpha/beta hydrolase-fold protein [Paenibacillus sp. S150]MBW4082230.1 alpha/beta hydrolase [Paenibacillus sp. S150]
MEGTFRREEVRGRRLMIYLPRSYGTEGRKYPVVYLQDEGSVMRQTTNYLEHLSITGELPELIFVGIATPDRNHEYTPWPRAAATPGSPDFGGGGSGYLKELVEVIKPYIDRHYATLPGRADTGLIGYSLGGLISMYAYYLYPDIFGRIGLLSASFWYEGMLEYMRTRVATPCGPQLYMYVGELEGLYKTNVQKQMVPSTRKAHRLLKEQGLSEQVLRFDTDRQGTHDSVFFSRQLPAALKWLFGAGHDAG